MKKLMFFFIVLFAIRVFPQISPAEFPKIGYADLYWLQKLRISDHVDYADSSYYYPRLRQLGLTHVVSYTDDNTKTPTLNNGIKILDNAFPRNANDDYNNPFKYANATGDYIYHFPYEAGGSNIALITSQDHNFGFGNTSGNSSWWIFPYDGECIGDINKSDTQAGETHIVHYAQVGVHSTGILLKAKPDATHFPYDDRWGHIYNLKLRILARIDGAPGTVNVARVHVWEQMPSMLGGNGTPAYISSNEGIQNLMMESQTGKSSAVNTSLLTLTDYTYYITANDFNGNNYTELISPSTFRKTKGINAQGGPSELYITIEWLGTRNLYIDKIAIYSTYYDDLFIANSDSDTVSNNIMSDLEGLFGSVKTHQSFAHPYNDEPYPMMYRAVGKVSNLSETQLGIGKYVNGATGGHPVDMLMLANSQRRVPYVLYDLYPITPYYDSASTGTNSIQGAWDNLINKSIGNVGYGVERYTGIKQAIQMSQNYTPDNTSDDVPFYHTIQVQAEKFDSAGIVTDVRFREPRYYEILAQGNLALCYGAKGMMYFLIMTNALYTTGNEPNYYGLFEESGNIGGIVQNPSNPQVPNYRFNAVQKLNQYIDKISSEVLQLTWRNGFSIHQGQPSGTYISNISSATTSGVTDASGSNYVELGTFKKTSDFSNTNLEYFMIVNRRVLSSETRKITVTFNKISSYTTWKVREVGTDNYWIVSNTGSFQATYAPGEGKLFKFEPLFLNSTETFSGATVVVNSSITVPSGKTLIISSGSTLLFGSSLSLIVNGTLTAIGNSSNKITFDRSSTTGTWGSIIFDGSGTSGSILDNVEIKYASDVRCLNQANITIKNSLLDNCINGIYVYNSAPIIKLNNINEPQQNGIYGQTSGYQPNIQDNVIKKTSSNPGYHNYQGIWFYSNSSVYANHNDLSGFYWGAYIGGGSYASFYYSSKGLYPYNRFTNNLYGIAAGWGSTITANWIVGDGGNSIYNNTYYDAYCYNNSTIYGQKNYWGGGNPKQSSYNNSYIYIDPILTEDPWKSRMLPPHMLPPLASIENNSVQEDIIQLSYQSINKESQFDELSTIFTALELENGKQIDQAIEFYKNLIANDKLVIFSLNKLMKLQNEYIGKDITTYLKELTKSKKYGSLANKLLGDIYLQSGQFANAITIYNSIIENYPDDYQSINARFEKLFAYLNVKKDKAEANKILTEIKKMNLKEDEWAMLIDAADYLINGSVNKLILPKQYTNTENKILTKYNLSQNYPNPFNPITLLNYSLKEAGLVKIKVYDILGREVAELVNEIKEAGYHSVEFNASNLPSGVYIYTLQVNGFSASRKMLLLK